MFGGFGIPELLIVLVIVLVFFGAGKLPEIGSALGKGIRGFRSSMNEGPGEGKEEESAPESLEQKQGETIEGQTVERKEEEEEKRS
jgi:sec-independent protein translocase protein TatA